MKFFRKIVIGISTIAFTTVALTSTTYAWFKINSRASVTGMNFKLTGGLGFYVSVDGVNYSNDLTADDIYMAMIAKNASLNYKIHQDENTNETGLYHYKKDENDEIQYDNNPITPGEVRELARNSIQLTPLTSRDGVDMRNLYNVESQVTSGHFVEFDVYFKTVSQTGYRLATEYVEDGEYYDYDSVNEKYTTTNTPTTINNYFEKYVYKGAELKYDIYLNGDNNWIDPATGRETSVSPTSFTSSVEDPISLSADMTTLENGSQVTKPQGSLVSVYSANALRMSITDNKAYAESGGDLGSIVYELNDTIHNSDNLGSYATKDYIDSCDELGIAPNDLEKLMYDYNCNASYTYYSHLKGASDLTTSVLYNKMYSYKDIPYHTVKYADLLRDGDGNYPNNKVITTLSSNDLNPTLLTFRIWLEGWDADCFDGIQGNIQALLSFVAVAK